MSKTRTLPGQEKCFSIGDPDGLFPVFSPEGARRVAGRWHEAGCAIIYAAEHYSTAMLEKLVHFNGLLPSNQHYIEITLPAGLSYEVVNEAVLPDWHNVSCESSRAFGTEWYNLKRSLLLIVPSIVARVERNVLINSEHPDFGRVIEALEEPIWWDNRLFSDT